MSKSDSKNALLENNTAQFCTYRYASSGPESSHSSEVLLFTFKGYSQHSGVGVTQVIVLIDERNTPLVIR